MRFLFWSFLLLLLALRIFLYLANKPHYPDGQKIRITERVSSQPVRYSSFQKITLSGFDIYLPLYPEVSYGDKVVVEGVVEEKKLSSSRLVSREEGKGLLYGLRKRLLAFYRKSLPEPHASLISGVTLGAKTGIPADFWKVLVSTGTAHVVVASGLNVTLIAGFLMNFLTLIFPRRKAVPLALVGVWGYSVLAGFDAPIIRAALMGSLSLAAQKLGKLYDAWRALFLSVFVMLLVRPDWISDLGFILSFVSTASLMLFSIKVDRLIHFVPGFFRQGFSTSLAAQIGIAPILFVTFGRFNIFSPLINAALLWTIPYMTQIAMVAGLVGLLVEPLGELILWLTFPLTSWFVLVVSSFHFPISN